jgi:hypothetical protein
MNALWAKLDWNQHLLRNIPQGLNGLRKKCRSSEKLPAAAKAGVHSVALFGTVETVPFQNQGLFRSPVKARFLSFGLRHE